MRMFAFLFPWIPTITKAHKTGWDYTIRLLSPGIWNKSLLWSILKTQIETLRTREKHDSQSLSQVSRILFLPPKPKSGFTMKIWTGNTKLDPDHYPGPRTRSNGQFHWLLLLFFCWDLADGEIHIFTDLLRYNTSTEKETSVQQNLSENKTALSKNVTNTDFWSRWTQRKCIKSCTHRIGGNPNTM